MAAPAAAGSIGLVSAVLGAYCQAVQYSGQRDPRFEEGITYPCAGACPPGVYRREENVRGA